MGTLRVTEEYAEVLLDGVETLSKLRVTEEYAEVILYNQTGPTTTTAIVEIDLNNDGDFADTNEDVSAYVKRIEIQSSGTDPATGDTILGEATIVFKNDDGRFSPHNSGSALYPNLKRGRPIRIQETHLGVTVTRFRGKIGNIQPNPDRRIQECTITAVDPLDDLRNAYVQGRDWQGVNISTIISNVLADASWTLGTSIDVTGDAPAYVQIPPDQDTLGLLGEIATTEGGRFYTLPDGTFRYEERHYRRRAEQSLYATYSGTFTSIEMGEPLREIATSVRVDVQPLAKGYLQEVWKQHEGGVVVKANTSKTVYAEFDTQTVNLQAPTTGNEDIASLYTDGTGDAAASLTVAVTNYGRRAKVVLTNAHASKDLRISTLRLRGQPIVTREEFAAPAITSDEQAMRYPRPISQSVEVSDTTTGLGTIPISISPFYMSSETFARALAQETLDRKKVERAVVTVTFQTDDATRQQELLGLRVSHRIRLVESRWLGLDKQFWVTRWHETIEPGLPSKFTVEAVECEANQTVWRLGRNALSTSPALVNF